MTEKKTRVPRRKTLDFTRFSVECSFANNLQCIRKARGYTRQDISDMLSELSGTAVRKEVVYQLETVRVRPSIGRIVDLAHVLECEPADLLRLSVSPADKYAKRLAKDRDREI